MRKLLLLVLIAGCTAKGQSEEEDKVYINIEGKQIEIVADEYGNQYLKQTTGNGYFYIPFTFQSEDPQTDSLKYYQANEKEIRNNKHKRNW